MSRPTRTIAAAVATTALLLVSACNSASTTGSSETEDSVRGVSDTSVKVGGIVSMTTASGYSKKDTDLGAKARFDRANAEGGVNGRKIDYLGAEDDGQDPAKNLTAARKLVQQDKVFAIAPMSSTTFSGADFLQKQKVPTFGWGTLPFVLRAHVHLRLRRLHGADARRHHLADLARGPEEGAGRLDRQERGDPRQRQ
ncbi:ABC transporter substrate-binding protein [Streptomyces sp. GTA36]